MQHGVDWSGQDLAGWLMSEKLDGCRLYWDGTQAWTRGGHAVTLPDDWQLPAMALDGELYDGPGGVYRCGAAMRYGRFTASMRLCVFDAPHVAGDWLERIAAASQALSGNLFAQIIPHRLCRSTSDAFAELEVVQARGGEGLMLRASGLRYIAGRTAQLLKLKELLSIAATPSDLPRARVLVALGLWSSVDNVRGSVDAPHVPKFAETDR